MPPSLSKGGIRNEKGSGKAAANEPMSEPKRRRTAASTDHVRPASLEMFHVKHPFALAKERAFGLGLRARGSRSPGTQGPGCRLTGSRRAASGWGSRRAASGWAHGLRTRARGSRAARSRTSGCGLCPSGAAAIPRSARAATFQADGALSDWPFEGTSLSQASGRRCRTRQAQGQASTSKGLLQRKITVLGHKAPGSADPGWWVSPTPGGSPFTQ